jgi:glycerate-2-kinase
MNHLTEDAIAIWRAAVAAADSSRMVQEAVKLDPLKSGLVIDQEFYALTDTSRIIVVGAGKACAGMAQGMEQALSGTNFFDLLTGWVNVPADCLMPLEKIHLHPARQAGSNFPEQAGIEGTTAILKLLQDVTPADLVIVLMSGGGSALLPLPIPEITLEQKNDVIKHLSQSGATIHDMNLVRICLSQVKGGRLLAHVKQDPSQLNPIKMVALIISDIIGDPLELIASGPTVPGPIPYAAALEVLQKYSTNSASYKLVLETLKQKSSEPEPTPPSHIVCHNLLIGNNQIVLHAAQVVADRMEYDTHTEHEAYQGEAVTRGRELVNHCLKLQATLNPGQKICWISGGETVVKLAASSHPRKGGRNQETILSAIVALQDLDADALGIVILSGGTDGEDGPTDAAGGWVDADVLQTANEKSLATKDSLKINNSYPVLDACQGLLKTGPTHTNVMDVQVCLIAHPDHV